MSSILLINLFILPCTFMPLREKILRCEFKLAASEAVEKKSMLFRFYFIQALVRGAREPGRTDRYECGNVGPFTQKRGLEERYKEYKETNI